MDIASSSPERTKQLNKFVAFRWDRSCRRLFRLSRVAAHGKEEEAEDDAAETCCALPAATHGRIAETHQADLLRLVARMHPKGFSVGLHLLR